MSSSKADKSVLIVGNGSAGKRHALNAIDLGYSIVTVDPKAKADFQNIFDAMRDRTYSKYVVASPPDHHVSNIYDILWCDPDAKILCEKPICGFSQQDFNVLCVDKVFLDNTVMVAYNYVFHPELQTINTKNQISNWWILECSQYRQKHPSWGFLLDHVSHDIDILRHLGLSFDKLDAHYIKHNFGTEWIIHGKSGNTKFQISDYVSSVPCPRSATLKTPYSNDPIFITADPNMYAKMWRYFDRSEFGYYPNVSTSLLTQSILMEAKKNGIR